MKTLILFLSIISSVVITPIDEITADSRLRTVTAVFDAYEGDIYFFTNKSNDEALTLTVKDNAVVKHFGLTENENVGETFYITLEKDIKNSIITNLEKLESSN